MRKDMKISLLVLLYLIQLCSFYLSVVFINHVIVLPLFAVICFAMVISMWVLSTFSYLISKFEIWLVERKDSIDFLDDEDQW